MKRINILDVETSNKIAAGEVVERPSSAVKELVENSIDAEAKNISIEIIDGGETQIKIIDDGKGIHPEDVEKAFMPHATSKIELIEDIFSISSLGFRGEALASIAAISDTTLKSRTKDFELGKEIKVVGGKIISINDAGNNIGTTIDVKNIFYNVPARKKFLKSQSREASVIGDLVSRIALANSEISFKLLNNGKKVLHTYGSKNVLDVIRIVYGKNISDNVTYFEKHEDIISIHGYIGNESISRGSRNNQSIFVNKRLIKSKLITAAIENAFKSFLTINKYPFFVVFIDIFPEFIDVNVHPTKSEIKFKDDRFIFKMVFDAVHEALRRNLKADFMFMEEDKVFLSEHSEVLENNSSINYIEPLKIFEKEDLANSKIEVNLPLDLNPIKQPYSNENKVNNHNEIIKESQNVDINAYITKEAKLPKFNIIGQFNNTYIIAEFKDTMYMIDQHAAHEKILFEKYRDEIRKKQVVIQGLLVPVVLELNLEDYSWYKENEDIFNIAGFSIEEFGENTLTIREVPYVLGKLNPKETFFEIMDNIKNMGSGSTEEIKYNRIATMACKSAIKANDKLSEREMEELIEQLTYIEDPYNCPHGRPTIIKFSLYELEKKFKRVQ